MESKGGWQNKYAFLDVIDQSVSVPQQRRSMKGDILNDEMQQSMEGSRTCMMRSRSLGEVSAAGHESNSRN